MSGMRQRGVLLSSLVLLPSPRLHLPFAVFINSQRYKLLIYRRATYFYIMQVRGESMVCFS